MKERILYVPAPMLDKNDEIIGQIAYVPIANFKTSKPKVCETERHEGQDIEAYAVVALQGLLQRLRPRHAWSQLEFA